MALQILVRLVALKYLQNSCLLGWFYPDFVIVLSKEICLMQSTLHGQKQTEVQQTKMTEFF